MSDAPVTVDELRPSRRLLPLQRELFVAVVLVVGAIFLCWAAWMIVGPVIPAQTLKSLRGATQADVRRILGEPSEVQSDGTWVYDRPPTQGWVQISFDDDGLVQSVNDEQAMPEVFGSGSWQR